MGAAPGHGAREIEAAASVGEWRLVKVAKSPARRCGRKVKSRRAAKHTEAAGTTHQAQLGKAASMHVRAPHADIIGGWAHIHTMRVAVRV